MTAEVWTWIFIVITFATYLTIGWLARVKETSGFYVAGRDVPAIANGAATAADWMSAASFISLAGIVSAKGADGSVYLLGWTGGYVLLALLLAPYLRRFGQFTVPDFVGTRYGSETARVVAALCAIFVSMTYIAGQMNGVGIVFSRYFGVPVWTGVIIGMAVVAFFALLGGMKGITWTQVVQYFVLIFAFMIPAALVSKQLTGSPVPQAGILTSDIAPNLNSLYVDLGFDKYTDSFSNLSGWNMWNVLAITFALMVGTAGLPHVIVRFYTTSTVRAARYSAFWALLFIAILYTTVPAVAMFARSNFLKTFHEQPVEEVKELDWVSKWERTGLLKYADKPTEQNPQGDGKLQMGPGNAFEMKQKKPTENLDTSNDNEVFIHNDMVVLASPEAANLPAFVIALVAVGGLAAALSTAAGLLLVISSSAAHDLYIHFVEPNASESRRVFVGRIMIVLAIGVAGYFGINPPGVVAEVVAFAFGLAAASFFPIIILGIFSKRTNHQGVVCGMLTGLLFTGGYIVAEKFWGIDFKSILGDFYIAPEGIGTIGCFLNFVVTMAISQLTPAPSEELTEVVDRVRYPDMEPNELPTQ